MSLEYWACEGIGFEQKAIAPFLDAGKLEELIRSSEEIEPVDNEFKIEHNFESINNEEKVRLLLDEFAYQDNYQLAGLLAMQNEERVLICTTDGEGAYYLIYPPRYPWENTGEFRSQEELVEYIVEFVMQFCRRDVSVQEITDIVDVDIYEVGCG